MTKYILIRILSTIPVLIGASIILFCIMQLAPGGPEMVFINPEDFESVQIDLIRHRLGLDQPLHIQYLKWLSSALRGEMGISFFYHQPVRDLVLDRLPATLQMTVGGLALALVVAIPIGILAAVKQYSLLDNVVTLFTFFTISFPGFWLGLMLIFVFAGKLGWFPPSGIVSIGQEHNFLSRLHHAVLPTVTLATAFMAQYIRYIRSGMLEVLSQDYIRTARSKGLQERQVLVRHAFRNALLVPITLVGQSLGYLVGGSVLLETVFAWPGVGRLAVGAVFDRDYPVTMGVALFATFMTVIGNLMADMLYVWADPRIRYG